MGRPYRFPLLGLLLVLSLPQGLRGQEKSAPAAWLGEPRQLTFEGEKAGEGYFSPDGREIVYQAVLDGCPHYQIFRRPLAGGPPQRVSTGQGMTTCAYYHPTDGTILFASTHLDPSTYGPPPANPPGGRYAWDKHASFDIFSARPDGSGLVRLTDTPGYDAEGNYSADGNWIVFSSMRDGDAEIYTMKSDGTFPRRITRVKGYDGGPFFSPDGRKICFRGFRDLRPGMERWSQVYVVDADGSHERQLTFNTAVNWAPFFHPDGKHLIYCTNVDGGRNFELVLLRIEDAKIVRLTDHPDVDILPVFSPNGLQVMWTTTRFGGKSQLAIADFKMPPPEAFGEPFRDDPAASHDHGEGAPKAPPARVVGTQEGPTSAASHQAAEGDRIDAKDALAHVAVLASDEFEGRAPGTEGGEKATRYIEGRMTALGLKPAGTKGFRDGFTVVSGARAEGANAATLSRSGQADRPLRLDEDFRPLASSPAAKAEGPAVFVGYGVTAEDGSWDDYAGLDVTGKIVVAFLRGVPDLPADPNNPHGGLGLFADERYKIFNAAQHGAAGVVFVADSRQRDAEGLVSLEHSGGGRDKIPAVQVKRSLLVDWARAAGLDLPAAEKAIQEAKKSSSQLIADARLKLETSVKDVQASTANVIGRVDGSDSTLADRFIVIGAHYDHLGRGGPGSLAPGGGRGEIHNGADDNASGVSGLLELAEHFKAHPPRHTIVFMAFSGEEMGLLGSKAWIESPTLPLDHCVAMINMDMIGRLGSQGVAVDGVDTWAGWRGLLEKANEEHLKLATTSGAMSGRSDHASFINHGIPSIHVFTGSHVDYHTPSDDVEKINVDGMVQVIRLVARVASAVDLENGPMAFEKPKAPEAKVTGAGYGAYLGTIPSYSEESGGVRLEGASPGSPAEKAGLRKDDVIVKIAEVDIDNIYDFTNALRSKRPGDLIVVSVLRDGKKVDLNVTLGRR